MKTKNHNAADLNRRSFIRTSAAAGIGLAVSPMLSFGRAREVEKIRLGFIGVGSRGRSHISNILNRDDVIIPAICDVDPDAINRSLKMINDAGHEKPEVYSEYSLS